MRKVFFVMVFLLFSAPCYAVDLICDPQAGVVSYNLDDNGVVTTGYPAEADGSAKVNIDGLSSGLHVFKLQAVGLGGWPSGWSDPLDAAKPGSPGNVRLSN